MSTDANKVELSGYAGYTPELITLTNGNRLARFSVATSEKYQNKNGEWMQDTTWHKIVMWNQMAEKALENISKGVKVTLIGKIQYRSYLDRTGKKHVTPEIIASSFILQNK